MKKIYNVLKIVIMALLMLIIFQTKSSANSISKIDMDVYIDNQGNATITEVWTTNMSKGTEGYRPYTNLGNSKISNFTVTDETGKQYQSLSNWNTNASFNSKAYKSGLHYIADGVELCWGISSYGNKTYTLKYNISNLVTQYTDTQGIYFNFINIDQKIDNVNITIRSNYKFSLDNSKIWAFGNNGTINFKNGNIVLNSGSTLSSSQYMVALVRFEKNLFNTNNISNKTFDDIYESAMSDVSDNLYNGFTKQQIYMYLISSVFKGLLYVIPIIILYKLLRKSKSKKSVTREYAPLDIGNKITKSEINYFREIPCDGDLYYAYWILLKFNVLKEEDCKNGLIGAILLDYIRKDYIKISETPKGLFDFRNNNYCIDLSNLANLEVKNNQLEKELIEILKQASGYNNLLEAKEFEEWCKTNYNIVNNWFDNVVKYQTTRLQQRRLITETIENKRNKTIITKHVDSTVRNEAIKLLGLKQFLLDYSLISERESIEVNLWEDYLIFAQLLGIAEKVEEQFSKIYPDFNRLSTINTEYTTICARALSSSVIDIVIKETIKQEKRSQKALRSHSYSRDDRYSGNDRDSGGGGNSYRSGGSSAGGSSGGGFR